MTSVIALESKQKTPVAIVGARGYSGLELSRLLLKHPHAELTACFATQNFRLSDYLPEKSARAIPGRATEELLSSVHAEGLKVVFLATPAATSMALAPKLLEAGVNVVDLSGAFRLQAGDVKEKTAAYKLWSGEEHTALPYLQMAQYGLIPWLGTLSTATTPTRSTGPYLIANPGCFATAILMALLPLLKARVIDPQTLVIDAKSGTTGAGRKAEERLLQAEVDGLCLPYRVGQHQHQPEIEQFALKFAQTAIHPHFTTHLLNVRRGIISGLYAGVIKQNPNETSVTTRARIQESLAAAYGGNPLVEFGDLDAAGNDMLLNLRRVVGSARTQLAYRVVGQKLYFFSLIDNLMKGAASQAVENFNRLMGLPTWLGLAETEGTL